MKKKINLDLTSDEAENVLFAIRSTVGEMSVDSSEDMFRELEEKIRSQALRQDSRNKGFQKKK